MATYKTKGIIIKRSHFGEADRILTIFSDKMGKIRAIGKGIRKQNSRLGGHLELFCLGNLVIAEGRNLDIVTEAEIIECFFDIRNNLKSTHISYYLAEAIDKMTAEYEKHEEVFNLLLEVLNSVGKINDDLLIAFFELKLLSYLGFKPELNYCLKCHRKLDEINYFDSAEGGLICQNCSHHGLQISPNAIKLFRLFIRDHLDGLKKIKIATSIQKEARTITQNYLDYISGQEFKSRRFILTK